tara:strand:+ start:947 stop:1648 length:702 start_codon:yes stop_codon:yes gene_type:complete
MKTQDLKEYYGTLSQTMNALIKLGYTLDFNIKEECLVCHRTKTQLSPEEFVIDKTYRFEGMSDPEDQAILYAISSPQHKVKGLLVNSYGVNSDESSSMLVSKLNITYTTSSSKENEPKELFEESLAEMNLPELISNLKKESAWTEKELVSKVIYKSSSMRLMLIGLHENAVLKEHSSKGAISVQVISGEVIFETAEKTVNLKEGGLIALAGGINHSVSALKESFFLLTISLNN